MDRRFYSGRLLPGALRGRAGRRAACTYVLLRNSFSGKWGSFAQQRPLALSSVRRQPPCNVTVRHQDALAYLRALPSLAHQCIYADPPYIFPGRSMNYYGTRGGHDLVFHTELQDALFASGLPFVVSVNDVPEARELYSRADSITSLCSGKNSSKLELLVVHRGSCCHSRIGFFGMKPNSGSNALPIASLPQDFSGKIEAKAKLENLPRCRAKAESRPCWKNPDLGAAQARQAGNCRIRRQFRKKEFLGRIPTLARAWQGSNAGQVARGSWASQLLAKKSVLQSSPHGRTGIFFLGRIPTLARAPMPGRWRGRVAHPECQEHVHPTCTPTC